MTTLIATVGRAQDAGLTLTRNGDRLTIRGGRQHAALVRAILARKAEALTLVEVYNGESPSLDWRHATVSDRPRRCVYCKRWAFIRDPFDGQPIHKTCAEIRIRPSRSEEKKAS